MAGRCCCCCSVLLHATASIPSACRHKSGGWICLKSSTSPRPSSLHVAISYLWFGKKMALPISRVARSSAVASTSLRSSFALQQRLASTGVFNGPKDAVCAQSCERLGGESSQNVALYTNTMLLQSELLPYLKVHPAEFCLPPSAQSGNYVVSLIPGAPSPELLNESCTVETDSAFCR